jgi:hypothetical protein
VVLEANHWYFVARNGTTQYLIRDKTVIHSEVAASDALTTHTEYTSVGCLNASGSPSNFGNFKIKSIMIAEYSTLDFDAAVDGANYVLTHWND